MKTLTDTTDAADAVQISIWAKMTVVERFSRAVELSRMLLESSRAVIDRANGHVSDNERLVLYVAAQYGDELAERVRRRLETGIPGS